MMLKDLANLRKQMEQALAEGSDQLALTLLRKYLKMWHQIWLDHR